jgi:hypothetical protein
MRRGTLTWLAAIAGSAIALCLGAVAAAHSIYVEVGNVKTTFSASVKPRTLPRSERAPIAISLFSKVAGRGQAHIPAISRAKIGIDKSLTVDARGVPVCAPGQLENQTTEAAEASCAAALVGSGTAIAEIAFGGGAPIRTETRLLAFNGGTVGMTTTILVHAYLTVPAIQALVVPIALTKVTGGGYGLRALVTIPRIASGAGSLARFDLAFRKRVTTVGGARHGYLLARCSDGNLVFEPEVEFDDGNFARGLLAEGCDPAG